MSDLRSLLDTHFGGQATRQHCNSTQRLSVDPRCLDYHRSRRHYAAAVASSNDATIATELAAAIAECRGEPLAGLKGGRLHALRVDAMVGSGRGAEIEHYLAHVPFGYSAREWLRDHAQRALQALASSQATSSVSAGTCCSLTP